VGERAFEIKLAQELAENGGSNAWFTRHDATQTTEFPAEWPEAYKTLIENRLTVMETERFIKLIEKPEFKRRWMSLEWEKQEQEAKEEAKGVATTLIENAQASIEQEKQAALAEIKKSVAELSIGIAESVIKRELASKEDQLQLVEGILKDVTLN